MAWDNRDYYRDDEPDGGMRRVPGIAANVPAMTLWLLVINVGVFLVDSILTGSARGDWASPTMLGYFSFDKAISGYQVWRVGTYQFLHGGFFHLLFNMIGLWIFGGLMERWWGSKRFLAFYLLSGIGGGLAFGLVGFVPGIAFVTTETPLVGASACVLGCVVGCMMHFGKQSIGLLLIPITFTMFSLGAIYIFLDMLEVLAGGTGAGSAVAHMGGAVTGYVLLKQKGLVNWADRVSPSSVQDKINEGRWERKQNKTQAEEDELDRLLDKVSQHGLHSLSKKETKRLNQLSESKRRDA